MQPLFVSRYVMTPKAELLPEPQRVLSLCPFQKKTSPNPFTTRGRVHSSVPRAGAGAGAGPVCARAPVPMRAWGCSSGDYEHGCAGQSHVPTVSSATPGPLRPQQLCHCLLCHRNETLQALLSSPTKGSALMGKMFLPAVMGQQGSASQVRFYAVLLLGCFRFFRGLERIYINASKLWSSKNE